MRILIEINVVIVVSVELSLSLNRYTKIVSTIQRFHLYDVKIKRRIGLIRARIGSNVIIFSVPGVSFDLAPRLVVLYNLSLKRCYSSNVIASTD